MLYFLLIKVLDFFFFSFLFLLEIWPLMIEQQKSSFLLGEYVSSWIEIRSIALYAIYFNC